MAVVVWWFYKSKSPWTCCHTWDHVNKQPETTLMKPTEHPAMCDSSLFKCKHAAHHTLLALQGQSDESVINDSGNNFRHRGLTKCFWKMLKRLKKKCTRCHLWGCSYRPTHGPISSWYFQGSVASATPQDLRSPATTIPITPVISVPRSLEQSVHSGKAHRLIYSGVNLDAKLFCILIFLSNLFCQASPFIVWDQPITMKIRWINIEENVFFVYFRVLTASKQHYIFN